MLAAVRTFNIYNDRTSEKRLIFILSWNCLQSGLNISFQLKPRIVLLLIIPYSVLNLNIIQSSITINVEPNFYQLLQYYGTIKLDVFCSEFQLFHIFESIIFISDLINSEFKQNT